MSGPKPTEDDFVETVKTHNRDRYDSRFTDDQIEDAVEWWIETHGKPNLDREHSVSEMILRCLDYHQSREDTESSPNDANRQYESERGIIDDVPYGEGVEEQIALNELRRLVKPWVHHWREKIFDDQATPFDTIRAAFRWIEKVAGRDNYTDQRKAKRYQDEPISPKAVEQDDEIPELYPAIIPGTDLSVGNGELVEPPTEDDKNKLSNLVEEKNKALKLEEKWVNEGYAGESWEDPDWNPPRKARSYFSRLEDRAESLSRMTGFTDIGLIVHVLTPYEPTKTRYRIIKHRHSSVGGTEGDGDLNYLGFLERRSVTIELNTPDITKQEIKEKILDKVVNHLNASGKRPLPSDYLKMYELYQEMGGPNQYETKGKFWEDFKEKFEERYPEKEPVSPHTYRINFREQVIKRLKEDFPGLMKSLDSTN